VEMPIYHQDKSGVDVLSWEVYPGIAFRRGHSKHTAFHVRIFSTLFFRFIRANDKENKN